MRKALPIFLLFLLANGGCLSILPSCVAAELPVDRDSLENGFEEIPCFGIRNLLSLDQIRSVIRSGKEGLSVDLSGVRSLLDGSHVEPSRIYGTAYAGPYPFEAEESDFAYKRFRLEAKIRNGRAVLPVGRLLTGKTNSEDWTDEGQLAVRLDLALEDPGRDRPLGAYDTFVFFRRTGDEFERLPSIVEGPLVNMIRSDDPSSCVISLVTDVAIKAAIVLKDGRRFESGGPVRNHEITLRGLRPDRLYSYRAVVGDMSTRAYTFRTAPLPGRTPLEGKGIVFAYAGDSREGIGGGTEGIMGSNHAVLEKLLALAYRKDAALLLMGGDLVIGNTTSPADMRVQYHSWKQAAAGFWHQRPVYAIMGNHESVFRVFTKDFRRRIRMDRWPYGVEDSQTLFTQAFVNPTNGPEPSDPRRPAYGETVYSFQYGPFKVIGFNNNYWVVKGSHRFGGAPEGYVLEDQLDWIKNELIVSEKDPSVHHILLFAQEPVFPNGGHLGDAMWWNGNNNVRATTFVKGRMVPERRGIVEVRNELVRAVAASPKVAAVLGSDEHGYHRTLIGPKVPIGDPAVDDPDGDGKLEKTSPLPDLQYRTWYIVSGGAGAPYYSEEPSPWNRFWKERPVGGKPSFGYTYSSQENILILKSTGNGVALEVYNRYGECFDTIQDLMAVKRRGPDP